MKIEKINENKVKITLTIDELSKRDLTIKDIEQDSNMAQNLFMDLLEETELNEEFMMDDSQLFVEAASDNENLFVVTITKIDYIPEISKYTSKKKTKTNSKIEYTVTSTIYKFENINKILELSAKLAEENVFIGTNSLYKYEDSYFIIFSDSSIKNKKFLKTYVILSEYSYEFYATDIYKTLIKEKAKLIIDKRALQKLSKI